MSFCFVYSEVYRLCFFVFFFFKQKTAYEMRISDWSSDVCSSDLTRVSQKWPKKDVQTMGYNIARYCFYLAISAHPSIRRSSPLPSGSPPPVATPDEQRKRSSSTSAPPPTSCPAPAGPALSHPAFSPPRCVTRQSAV